VFHKYSGIFTLKVQLQSCSVFSSTYWLTWLTWPCGIQHSTGLMTGHRNLRKQLHTIGIFKENPVCRLCNCIRMRSPGSSAVYLLGLVNPGEEISRRNLVNRLTWLREQTSSHRNKWTWNNTPSLWLQCWGCRRPTSTSLNYNLQSSTCMYGTASMHIV
jgi:hypothetical protein